MSSPEIKTDDYIVLPCAQGCGSDARNYREYVDIGKTSCNKCIAAYRINEKSFEINKIKKKLEQLRDTSEKQSTIEKIEKYILTHENILTSRETWFLTQFKQPWRMWWWKIRPSENKDNIPV